MSKQNKSKSKSQSKKGFLERIVDEVKGENDYVALQVTMTTGTTILIREEHLEIEDNHIIENREERKRLIPISKIEKYEILTNKVL